MRQLTKKELKEVQMNILDALVRFCNENNLRVSIASGTFIGAVRHKGYIPWDDDIDVFMLREDYVKLEQLLPEILDNRYKLESIYRNDKWHLSFAKLCDIRTTSVVERKNVIPYGAFVDIFPVDAVPDNNKEFRKYMRRLGMMRLLLNNTRKVTPNMGVMKKVAVIVHHAIISLFPNKRLVLFREKYNQKYNVKGFSSVYANSYGPLQPNPFPKSFFDDIIYYDFENRKVPGFKEAHRFLTLQYGDYMTLPPENKRVAHSETIFWIDN